MTSRAWSRCVLCGSQLHQSRHVTLERLPRSMRVRIVTVEIAAAEQMLCDAMTNICEAMMPNSYRTLSLLESILVAFPTLLEIFLAPSHVT